VEGVVRDLGMLADPVRIRLLALLSSDELGVGELCRVVQLPQSTVSRHLKALQVAGWVVRRSEGTSGWYRADLPSLPPEGRRLWDLVGGAFAPSDQAREDRDRLAAVLASREPDAFFGRMHGEWDALRRDLFGERFLLPAMASLLPPEWTVADLGCGTGPALVELAPVVRRVIGVDREPRMLDLARDRTASLPNVELRHGTLDHLPLADGEIDAALCVLVLHHVEHPHRAFAEARRALRPGGTLVVVDMVAHERRDWQLSMGHRHNGFGPDVLEQHAQRGGMRLRAYRAMPPEADARGPALFAAVLDGGTAPG
jgi:ArsR family transcriptional regulator